VVPVSFQFYDRKSTTLKKVIASATKPNAGMKNRIAGYFGSICASDFGVVCASDFGPNCAII